MSGFQELTAAVSLTHDEIMFHVMGGDDNIRCEAMAAKHK